MTVVAGTLCQSLMQDVKTLHVALTALAFTLMKTTYKNRGVKDEKQD
ncbi:Protein of unknown function [Lactobacillus helveticus CIRM-BIA 951]|uniref:Uncharacterized protein n=1 Tax=Lactobacillus helveticus CIRM-BIA 951 TaxID=1226334 RepID=U6F376_LACHE|nr:Protein of unknown function [Lactobacillus helveticus CIRM-BIA 951]